MNNNLFILLSEDGGGGGLKLLCGQHVELRLVHSSFLSAVNVRWLLMCKH